MYNMSQKVSALPIGVPKIRFSFRNHLLPPFIGIAVSFLMYGLLNFPAFEAQGRYYATQLFTAPQTTAVAANSVAVDDKLSKIIIPGINVKAPVIYESSADNTKIAYDLRSGVVHYGTTALPGEKGNVVIFGHSSGVAWELGDYKFIFTLLNKLQPGQQIILDYKGTQYVYVVTGSQIVAPNDMKVLDSNGAQSELSLITCTPVGTSTNRLVVHTKQVSPNPVNNVPFKPANSASLNELPSN
jgi:LPXTG-site transpeptidase (sortase) family protein